MKAQLELFGHRPPDGSFEFRACNRAFAGAAAELLGESNVDLPYWTLTYELIFYGLMACALAFGRLRKA
ncbi:MAG: hypothetical protein HC793_04665, partial [Aquincola sp.]|nr:hypothetical protein [Aquincola sp.]